MRLADGTELAPGLLLPLAASPDGTARVRVLIREGQYHQVRRMVAALGSHVTQLARVAIGCLALPDDLPPGAWRPATEVDLGLAFTVPEVWREAGLDA